MGVPTSKVGYTSAITGRVDHEVHKGHVVALEEGKLKKLADSIQPVNIWYLCSVFLVSFSHSLNISQGKEHIQT
jgi:hypothetical protein